MSIRVTITVLPYCHEHPDQDQLRTFPCFLFLVLADFTESHWILLNPGPPHPAPTVQTHGYRSRQSQGWILSFIRRVASWGGPPRRSFLKLRASEKIRRRIIAVDELVWKPKWWSERYMRGACQVEGSCIGLPRGEKALIKYVYVRILI